MHKNGLFEYVIIAWLSLFGFIDLMPANNQLPFRGFYINFEPSISKTLGFIWLRAILGLFLGPLGAAQGGVLGPLRLDSLHQAVSFHFRGFHTKFESSISKMLVFMA